MPWCPARVSWSPLPSRYPPGSLALLARGVLAGDARRDLGAALVQRLLDLLLVLPAEAEAMRPHHVLLGGDLVPHPGHVGRLVAPPHLPLAGIVLERVLPDHGDALLGRADGLADAAAAAGLHVGVVEPVWRDVEARVRALEPAERALHALVEVDDRAHRARGELLEIRVALGDIALAAFHGLTDGDGGNADALAHLPPLRLLEGERRLRIALDDLDRAALQSLEGLARRCRLELGAPLGLLDGRADGVQGKETGLDLGEGAQDPRLGVVLFVDPEPGEGGLGRDQGQVVGRFLLVDVLEQIRRALERGHEERAIGDGQPVDRLEYVPRPGLDALGQRVVHADGDVDFLGLVAGHVLLELFLRIRHDGEVLGRDAVALGAVPVAAEGDAPPPGLAGREHDAAADAGGEVLLEDAAIDDLAGEMGHTLPLGVGCPAGWYRAQVVCWSERTMLCGDVPVNPEEPSLAAVRQTEREA